MTDVFATIVCPSATVEQARAAAALVSGGSGMLTTGLSPTGALPATHYISSGMMPEALLSVLEKCNISFTDPLETLERLSLKLCETI